MIPTPATFTILLLIALFVGVYFLVNSKEKRPVDYYNLFIIGIVWLGAGIPIGNYTLSVIGFVFMLAGIVNKDKWKANHRRWGDLDKKEQKTRMIIMTLLGILVLLGFVLLYFGQK